MFIILLSVLFVVSVSIIGFSLHTGISPMPSSFKAKKKILSLLKSPKVIYELGSGWGGLSFSLAKAFPNAQLLGLEISYVPWLFSWIGQKISKRPNLTIARKNFFKESLTEGDVIVCYLCPTLMKKLKPKLERELKRGSVVISNSFAIPGWRADLIVQVEDLWHSEIFIYSR